MLDVTYKIFIPLMVYDYILANLDKNLLNQFMYFVMGSHHLDQIYRVDDIHKLNKCPDLKISIDNEGEVTLYPYASGLVTIHWDWVSDWLEQNRDIYNNVSSMNEYPLW